MGVIRLDRRLDQEGVRLHSMYGSMASRGLAMLSNCPRCKEKNVLVCKASDIYGKYNYCLICGYVYDYKRRLEVKINATR